MIGYAQREVFTQRELKLLERAATLVAITPYDFDGVLVRCHELARAVGDVLGLQHEDGRYGFVDHTWLWTEPRSDEKFKVPWVMPNVLDVYVPGGVPQVQLVHMATGLPSRYYLSNVLEVDPYLDVIAKIKHEWRRSPLWPVE